MASHRLSGYFPLIAMSLAALCACPILVAIFPDAFTGLFYSFVTAFSFFALGACFWRAWHCPPGMRAHWLLVATGLLCWAVANVMAAVSQLLSPDTITTATIEDFFYFFYGIPLLLALSMPENGESSPAFFLLDLIQATGAGYLTYVALFGVLPFTGIPMRPISQISLIAVYDVENLILVVLATARIVVGVRGAVERRFFRILTGYLWLYAICVTLYNHLAVSAGFADTHPILVNILASLANLPIVALALAAIILAVPSRRTPSSTEKTPLHLLADNARPIFISLALVALSAVVAHQHLRLALTFIFGAFVIYGIRSALLQSKIEHTRMELEKANDRLEEIALQDGLTGIANRRCFDQRLELEWGRAHRSQRPLALILIDVDHFKELNDSLGHVAGDECLLNLVAALQIVLRRPGDLLARYGGDEFVALLPETDASGAIRVAAMMQEAVASREWNCSPGSAPTTVSIGCSCWDSRHLATAEELIEAADKALYQAKQNGRNRVVLMEMHSTAELNVNR